MYDGDDDECQGVSGGRLLVLEEGLQGPERDSSEQNPVSP